LCGEGIKVSIQNPKKKHRKKQRKMKMRFPKPKKFTLVDAVIQVTSPNGSKSFELKKTKKTPDSDLK